jgi:uncharacterized protein (DUF1697 family)
MAGGPFATIGFSGLRTAIDAGMTAYVALLRAVNVAGQGKLLMADLRAMGEACGFADVRTFIASGNLLFESDLDEAAVNAVIEARLSDFAGKPIPVLIRTAAELRAIVASNPFPDAHRSRHLVYFHRTPPTAELIAGCRDINGERLALGARELHVDYGDGIRFTRLKIPGKEATTARSINSVRRMAALFS